MTAVDEIKARLDIVDIVSETVKLRRSGRNYTGFCPFHPNAKTPAFAVFTDSGTWRCFGQCNEGGDIFKFVMKREGWDFAETLKYLAAKAGVTLTPLTPERKEKEDEYETLRAILEEAVKYYQFQLTNTPAGKTAYDYLINRGILPESIEAFELGFAPNSFEALLSHLGGKNRSLAHMAEVGLVVERDSGGFYDKFHNRIMFPIRDAAGKITGFGARILNPDDMPKFLNSAQTPLFNKSNLLYGLNQAKKAIRGADQVVIVEGYLDVIALHQCGYNNTVSPMGTALTEIQLRQLKKYTRRIVLALDADAAGEKATLRGVEIARQTLDREDEIVFNPGGLLKHEARLQADVRITPIPAGLDPDDVVLKDPQEWQRILDRANPIVVHVMESLATGQNLDDAKVKAAIAAQVIPLIEDVPSAVERDAYRQQLARLLKVDERSLLGSQKVREPGRRKRLEPTDRRQTEVPPQSTAVENRNSQMEKHILALLLQETNRCSELERALRIANLKALTTEDFEDFQNQEIARLLLKGITQDMVDPLDFVKEHIPIEMQDRLFDLTNKARFEKILEEAFSLDLFRTLISLRLNRINQVLNQMRFLQDEDNPDQENQIDPTAMMQFMVERGKLDQALAKASMKFF